MTTASPTEPRSTVTFAPSSSFGRIRLSGTIAGTILATLEFSFLCASPYVGSIAYHAIALPNYAPPEHLTIAVGLVMSGLYLLVSHTRRAFDLKAMTTVSLTGPLVRWALAFMCFTWALFALKIGDIYSRGGLMAGFLIGASGIVALRLAVPGVVRHGLTSRWLVGRRAILLTAEAPRSHGELPADLQKAGVTAQSWIQLPYEGASKEDLAHFSADVADVLSQHRVDEILIVADAFGQPIVGRVLDALRVVPVRVLVLPRSPAIAKVSRQSPLTATALEVQTPPFSAAEGLAKRCFDIAVASALIVVLSPLLLAIAVAVRLDSRGPILFRQRRVGLGGRAFLIYKFRSMFALEDGPEIRQAERGDARVTKVGRLLRETSLDELPQLFNVVLGDMSLVGPRPHAVAHDRYYSPKIADYALRHHALPGITGLAQVTGFRGETPTLACMEGRVERDVWYVRNWSIWLDINILLKTIGAVLRKRDAY